jgi:hypothetical protein
LDANAFGVSPDDFDRIVDPKSMVGNPRRDLGSTGDVRRLPDPYGARHTASA